MGACVRAGAVGVVGQKEARAGADSVFGNLSRQVNGGDVPVNATEHRLPFAPCIVRPSEDKSAVTGCNVQTTFSTHPKP